MTTSRTPQFLYFDLGNVLLTFDAQIACRQVAELTGLAAQRVQDIIFASRLQWRYERGEVSSREFYEEFCAASHTRPDYDALHYANSAMFALNVPVIPIVAQLWASAIPARDSIQHVRGPLALCGRRPLRGDSQPV